MDTCDNGHEAIVFIWRGTPCPMCELIKELAGAKDKAEELQKEIDEHKRIVG